MTTMSIPLRRILHLSMLAGLLVSAVDSRGATGTTGPAEPAAPASAPTSAPSPRAITWDKTDITVPAAGGSINVLTLEDPGITAPSYSIRGTVSYTDVKGTGFLEMWSHFPDGSFFFSRTLDASGPMGALKGSSEPREFILPFFSRAGHLPSKLTVNVVLPEGGAVKLGPAQLTQPLGTGRADDPRAQGAWWDARQSGRMGGMLGATIGSIGAIIGILAGMGRSRRLVLSLAITTVVLSAALLVVGLFALAVHQPFAVWYPLLLGGGIGTLVLGLMIPSLKRRYAENELRKMSAADLAG